MRVVFDTNVLLSASFTPGVCEVLLEICLVSDDIQVILSEYILTEFLRNGIDKFQAPSVKVESTVDMLRQRCVIVEPAAMLGLQSTLLRDKDDLPILGTAVAAQADCLVTGDQELLALDNYQGIPILSPRAFYDRIRG